MLIVQAILSERAMNSKQHNTPASTLLHIGLVTVALGVSLGVGAYVLLRGDTVSHAQPVVVETMAAVAPKPSVAYVQTPAAVKAIYMSQCVVGTPTFRDELVAFIDDSELNAVVIDIQDYTGKIAFPTDNPLLHDAVSQKCGADDMKDFIATLHEKGIYVIGRITVFQNPYYASVHPEQAVQKKSGGVWKDFNGLAFVDVGAKAYWDYVVELGRVSHELGFDELNFDYVRYPSDGPMSEAVYTHSLGKSKAQMLEDFFAYLTGRLRLQETPDAPVPTLSADVFGMVATNTDDVGIGQVLERTLPYFDYVSPMIYPSHYHTGFHGYDDVNAHAYDIVKYAMQTAVARTVATTTRVATNNGVKVTSPVPAAQEVLDRAPLYVKESYVASKIRPWLQSFDYPVAYTPDMVRAQIKATQEAGVESYLFWDAANKYTSLRKVLLP